MKKVMNFVISIWNRCKLEGIGMYDSSMLKFRFFTGRQKLTGLAVLLGLISVSCVIGVAVGAKSGYDKAIYCLSNDSETGMLVLTYKDEFSEKKLVEMLQHLNVRNIPIVVAQARLESDNYKSHIFKDNNNMFGMKCAYSRIHTHDGEQHSHARYDTWRDCVLDYSFYQATYLSNVKSEEEYLMCLDASYSEIGGKYSDALRPIIEQVKKDYKL